jgi:hypothetical protein
VTAETLARENEVYQAAVECAAAGIPVFPIAAGTKRPHRLVPNGLLNATCDRDVIDGWFDADPSIDAFAAVPGGAGFVVIDIDTKNDGFGLLRDLEQRFGKLPDTRTTCTPRGGEHRWFSLPRGVKIDSKNAVFGQGVDIKSAGGYVLMPPSKRSNDPDAYVTDHYIADASETPTAALPQSWLDALTAPERSAAKSVGERIPEGSRNSELTSIAGKLRRPGLSEIVIRAALRAVNLEQCRPPLPEREVDSIAKSVARYEPDEKPDRTAELVERIKSASIVALEPPDPIDYDVATILPAEDAPGLIFGPPASLKSWLALKLCDAIVRGEPFLGYETRQRPSALYVNLDAGAKTFANRVRSISDAPGFDFVSLSASEFNAGVLRALIDRYRGGFIVLDCLSSIYNPDTKNDPAYAMRSFVDGLRAVFAEFGCGGVVIDHPHRPKERGELGDYHGSIQKEAAFRTMWAVAAEPAGDEPGPRRTRIVCRKLSEGQPFAPIDVEIDFTGPRISVQRADEARPATQTTALEAKILEWAAAQTTAFTQRTVTDKVQGRARDLRNAFDSLVAAGTIVPTGKKRGSGDLFRVADTASGTQSDATDATLPGTTAGVAADTASGSGTQRDATDAVGSATVMCIASLRPPIGDAHTQDALPDEPAKKGRKQKRRPCEFPLGAPGETCSRCGVAAVEHYGSRTERSA